MSEVLPFLKKHFLHWLEAMSLMGIIQEAVGMINTLQSCIGVSLHGIHFKAFTNPKLEQYGF